MNWIGRDGQPIPNGPWRRQAGLVADEDDHGVVLTNDARDSLILSADDVAAMANALAGPEPFDWDQAEPDLLQAFTDTIADNPPAFDMLMVTTVWAMEVLTALSDRGYVLVPRREQ